MFSFPFVNNTLESGRSFDRGLFNLKMKPKWNLRLNLSIDPSASTRTASSPTTMDNFSTTSATSQKNFKKSRHLSLHHEKVDAKKMNAKKTEIEHAVKYCRQFNCKGYRAIKELGLKYIKDARTINNHLQGKVITGDEKKDQRILTEKEEQSLVKYLINRNRPCQGLTDKQVEGVVLNILQVRQQHFKKGGRNRGAPLSANAKLAIKKKRIGRSFFRRLNTRYPILKRKSQQKVSAKRGLRCTRETAVEYIDEIAELMIELGIAPELKKQEPGIWNGAIDLTRIWAHDETPQFINFSSTGQSKKKIYAGSGHDCSIMTKENRESVTVHPFSNFAGDLAMCQIIFSGTGITSHMCPPAAADKIKNLLISVNQKGCSTGETLLSAYKELTTIIDQKKAHPGTETDLLIADGHKSWFNGKVMDYCESNNLEQYILPPDTSGITQKHDQINQQLHNKYEELKAEMYTGYSDINKECFMNILAEMWNNWALPERIQKAAKRVGVSKDGLNVNWMDQEKFLQAEAILNPPTPKKTLRPELQLNSPKGMRRHSAEYWKSLYLQRTNQLLLQEQEEVPYEIENVPGLLPYKKVKPNESVRRKITDVHGTLKATEVRELVRKKEEEEKQKEERKATKQILKEEMKTKFEICMQKCMCKEKEQLISRNVLYAKMFKNPDAQKRCAKLMVWLQ